MVDLVNMKFSTELDKYLNGQQILEIVNNFLKINIDELSISQAYDVLNDLQE